MFIPADSLLNALSWMYKLWIFNWNYYNCIRELAEQAIENSIDRDISRKINFTYRWYVLESFLYHFAPDDFIGLRNSQEKNIIFILKGLGLPIYWKKLAAITWTPTKGLISISTLKIEIVNAINSLYLSLSMMWIGTAGCFIRFKYIFIEKELVVFNEDEKL